MPKPIKILAFAGSTRTDSTNKKLARLGQQFISSQNVACEFIDLRDFPLPLYDGDLEVNEPYPENALNLKLLLKAHNGFLIASPEYNSSISGVLKNTIDWISRSEKQGTDLSAFSGKVVTLCSAAPGLLGGLRGLNTVRSILSNIGCIVLPNQFALSQAFDAFNEKGSLNDENKLKLYESAIQDLIKTTKQLKAD